MKDKLLILLLIPVALLFAFTGCEGPEGPAGPAGDQGNTGDKGDKGDQGDPYPMFSYLGDNAQRCAHCHGGLVDKYLATGHASTYADLEAGGNHNDIYCQSCHTTGHDSPVARGDTVFTVRGPNLHGFDDYFPPQNAVDSARVHSLKNVQCESCHGNMGPTIYDHRPLVSMGSNSAIGENESLCLKCHSGQINNWKDGAHGNTVPNNHATLEEYVAEFNRPGSDCWTCHTTEGFVNKHTPSYAGKAQPAHASTIGCVACHDPHNGFNEKQVRTTANVTALNTTHETKTFTGYGTAQLCVNCHKDRRDGPNIEGQIANGNSRFGPHHSNQMDMFLGVGSYEIEGYVYDRSDDAAHKNIENACIACHLVFENERGPNHRIHKFEVAVENCQTCHRSATSLDIRGFQTKIDSLLNVLEAEIGVPEADFGNRNLTTPEQRMAAYAHRFVSYDHSKGVHNPRYALSLLTNAIDFLRNQPVQQVDAGN